MSSNGVNDRPDKVVIGLSNPKSPDNVGAVMRAAACYGVNEVLYTGTRFDHATKYRTNTNKSNCTVSLVHQKDFYQHRPQNLNLICVELVVGAMPLPSYDHLANAFYIFGPEDGSLDQALVDQADDVLYVPTVGCLNLAASVNVVLYDRMAKSNRQFSDADIVQNRDTNNRLKLKNYAGRLR